MLGGEVVSISAREELPKEIVANGLEVGRWLHINFSDSGSGMTEETRSRIFEPFFTTKLGKGSGLGLAMAYGFVQHCKGHIEVASELGAGTQFHLYLPLSQAPTELPALGSAPIVEGGSERILLVDDELELLDITKNQLLDLSYEVVAASNAEDALIILSNNRDIDLLLTDIIMPGGMLGTELAAVAQRDNPSLKVLLTSVFDKGSGRKFTL